MASTTFTLGPDTRYEATHVLIYNGVKGIVWVKRIKADGGWMHDGKQFMPIGSTRQDVVERFGQIYNPEQVNA